MRTAVTRLLELGPFPSENDDRLPLEVSMALLEEYANLLGSLEWPATDEEAMSRTKKILASDWHGHCYISSRQRRVGPVPPRPPRLAGHSRHGYRATMSLGCNSSGSASRMGDDGESKGPKTISRASTRLPLRRVHPHSSQLYSLRALCDSAFEPSSVSLGLLGVLAVQPSSLTPRASDAAATPRCSPG